MLNDDSIEQLDFTGCIFNYIDLSKNKFTKPVYFSGATFKVADFSYTTFKEASIYTNIELDARGILDFSFSVFEQHLYIKPKETGYIIFRMTTFKRPSEIKIFNLSLSKVSFINTDLNGVALVPSENSKEILDDILLRNSQGTKSQNEQDPLDTIYKRLEGYLDIETLNLEYKTIRKCLEANRMFTEASDIYVKEMRNARKRINNKRVFEKAAHLLYDAISKYGESITRPSLGIILIIISGAFLIKPTIDEYLDNLQAVIAVAFQISSFKDLGIIDECMQQGNNLGCKHILSIEIFIRVLTLVFLGNLFIALKRRLERK